jgi:hypothetical protein
MPARLFVACSIGTLNHGIDFLTIHYGEPSPKVVNNFRFFNHVDVYNNPNKQVKLFPVRN